MSKVSESLPVFIPTRFGRSIYNTLLFKGEIKSFDVGRGFIDFCEVTDKDIRVNKDKKVILYIK